MISCKTNFVPKLSGWPSWITSLSERPQVTNNQNHHHQSNSNLTILIMAMNISMIIITNSNCFTINNNNNNSLRMKRASRSMLAGSGRESENAHLHQYNITITFISSLSTSATTGSPSYPALWSFCSRQHEAADGSLQTLTERRGRVVRTGPGSWLLLKVRMGYYKVL